MLSDDKKDNDKEDIDPLDPLEDFEVIDSSQVPTAEEAERKLKEVQEHVEKQKKEEEKKAEKKKAEDTVDGGISKLTNDIIDHTNFLTQLVDPNLVQVLMVLTKKVCISNAILLNTYHI